MEKQYEISIPGSTLTVYDDCVSFKHKGAMGFITKGIQGERKLFYKQIASVQFRAATGLTSGFIEFYLDGHHNSKQGGGLLSGTQNENRFYFYKRDQDEMKKDHDYIQDKISKINIIVVEESSTSSNADELRKFKQLFDDGIINEDEFKAKKKELLGL